MNEYAKTLKEQIDYLKCIQKNTFSPNEVCILADKICSLTKIYSNLPESAKRPAITIQFDTQKFCEDIKKLTGQLRNTQIELLEKKIAELELQLKERPEVINIKSPNPTINISFDREQFARETNQLCSAIRGNPVKEKEQPNG